MIFLALCSIVFFEYYQFYIKIVAVFVDMRDVGCLIFILIDICIFDVFYTFL